MVPKAIQTQVLCKWTSIVNLTRATTDGDEYTQEIRQTIKSHIQINCQFGNFERSLRQNLSIYDYIRSQTGA